MTASDYEIELSEPSTSRCDCCGGLNVRLTRFVHRHGDAYAVYYAAYSNNHPDNEVGMLVSLGEWGEDADPSRRAAFYCRVRPSEDAYEVMLGDAAESIWRDADIMGTRLSREEALGHPWKATAFEVLDEAFAQDPSLQGFLRRVKCGAAAEPLERSYHAPDPIFALGEEKEHRAFVSKNFAVLDGTRFFVRCLLPVPVEGYESWHIGLWIETEKSVFDQVAGAWDDPEAYPHLRFSGVVANDVAADLDLPLTMGTRVQLHVPDAAAPPKVEVPASGGLADLLSKPWPRAEFEEYAVARGFL